METFKFSLLQAEKNANFWINKLTDRMKILDPSLKLGNCTIVDSDNIAITFETDKYKEKYLLSQVWPCIIAFDKGDTEFIFSIPNNDEKTTEWFKEALRYAILSQDKKAIVEFCIGKHSLNMKIESEIYKSAHLLKVAYPVLHSEHQIPIAPSAYFQKIIKDVPPESLQNENGIPYSYYIPVDRFLFDKRTSNALAKYENTTGQLYLGDIAHGSSKDLLMIRNFGKTSLQEITKIMDSFSLFFQNNDNHLSWRKGNEKEISDKLFPGFLSVEQAWKLAVNRICPNVEELLNPKLLLPLKHFYKASIPKSYVNYLGGYPVYIGDLLSVKAINYKKDAKFKGLRHFTDEIDRIIFSLGLPQGSCSSDWFQEGFAEKAQQLFPDDNAIREFLK